MNEKLYKIVDGKRVELNKSEVQEYILKQNVEIDLNKIKQNKIKELKFNCSNYIYSIYPQYKQLDITNRINATEEDFNKMKGFIKNAIDTCNIKENKIEQCENLNELELIDINFNTTIVE